VSQVFPVILVIVPLFLILRQFRLVDSLVGLTLVHAVYALPFALWMLQGFIATIPRDVEEAGVVDGAGRVRVLVSIVAPLLAPGLVATAMFTMISSWNEFFFALVLIQDPAKVTLPLTLSRFLGAEGQVQLGALAAGALLATVPSLLFFAAIQRRLTSGLLSGAVKG
jgi:multiple sugar transport system permease protein